MSFFSAGGPVRGSGAVVFVSQLLNKSYPYDMRRHKICTNEVLHVVRIIPYAIASQYIYFLRILRVAQVGTMSRRSGVVCAPHIIIFSSNFITQNVLYSPIPNIPVVAVTMTGARIMRFGQMNSHSATWPVRTVGWVVATGIA